VLVDAGYNIIYLNSALQQMLREAEPEIRKALPSFSSSSLMGGAKLDVLYTDSALDRLAGTHQAQFAIGNLKFMIIATAVLDKDGKRNGIVIEWKNETVEKSIEEEVDRVVNAATDGDFSRRVPLEASPASCSTWPPR
jgi:methyl-accepting chemotaxis protein